MDFVYSHLRDGQLFTLDTRNIRSAIEDVPISHPDVLQFIRKHLKEGLNEIGAGY